jgi:hypothetical protein
MVLISCEKNEQADAILRTLEATNLTAYSATVGANITAGGELPVLSRGIMILLRRQHHRILQLPPVVGETAAIKLKLSLTGMIMAKLTWQAIIFIVLHKQVFQLRMAPG